MQMCELEFLHVYICRVGSHLSATHADDAVDAAAGIVEEGHSDSMFARWQPVTFGGRVDLEDMSSGAEDGLLPLKHTTINQNILTLQSDFLHLSSGDVA